ncbi:type IV secretion system DNA-binding domain-containing protein [Acidocella sp.]|uniref:type IV secretion system DNA-binding domain-containing protein n=1 Tax=Acidocella sp. TaxID=50710 RepID=UPI00261A1D03|nr:type IV secretion system DNA-binding domain-containing protein [Acidocella sp.]
MANVQNRRAHADALRARERANGQAQFRFAARALAVCAAGGALLFGWATSTAGQVKEVGEYTLASFIAYMLKATPADPVMNFTYQGQVYRIGVKELASIQGFGGDAIALAEQLALGGIIGLGVGGVCLWITADHRRRKQEELLADRIIAGTRVVNENDLARMTAPESHACPLRFGNVPVPYTLEPRHITILGTTGTGKTTALRQNLDAIEARGDTALIYDTSGEFIAHYYNPERGDIILNPFDRRGAFWNPFDEISHPADADRIARYLITETGEEDRDIWLDTSRMLVANVLRTLWQEGRRSPRDLLDALQSMPREKLERWLAHTSSARIFAQGADRATGSVLFMLSMAVNLLMFLRAMPREGETGFSFAHFLKTVDERPGPKPWIFVPRKEDYFEAMKPLMALWLECAASGVLGLAPAAKRRVWFILDELADMPRVDNLARLLPEGRKFGASVILTFQTIDLMRDRYGREGAEALLGCCNTKLFLQLVDQASREWASATIGMVEVEISTIADTLDPKTGKPQQTLSTTRETRPAVLESELRLPKHTAYLLLPDGLPAARIRLTDDHIHARGPAHHPGFVAGDIVETLWGGLQAAKGNKDKEAMAPGPSLPLGPGPV